MKFLIKAFPVIAAALVSLTSCSGDDSTSVKIEGPEGSYLFDLDSLVIPDSILESDSLYVWYMEQLIKKIPSSSSKANGSSASVEPEGEGEDPDADMDLSPKLLPPAGFYKELTIPAPAPSQKDATIYCQVTKVAESSGSLDYRSGSFKFESFEIFENDEPYKLTKNASISCSEQICAKDTCSTVRKSTQTYFIGETVSMPVVAISVDPSFFSRVYVSTSRCEGSDPYTCTGLMDETEDPIHVEYFENGSLSNGKTWEVDAGIGLMGNYSRTYPKKPVGVKIKKQYNEKKLKYSLFATRPEVNKFRGFNLRNSGNRYVGDLIGDPSMTAIVEGSSVDYQRSRQVVVFYNGTYFGIHDMRERLNEHFVETNYGIDNNTVEMIKQKKDVVTPVAGDGSYYNALLSFVANNDFSGENNEAYEEVQTMMDVGNYADYLAAQFYLQNADWPSNNMRAWRAPGQPFKFILFDTDQSLGWQWVSRDFLSNKGGMFGWIKNDRGEGRTGPGYFAHIYKKLSVNPDFQRMFINHGAVMMNEYLTYDRLTASVSAQNAMIPYSELERDLQTFQRDYCGFYSGMCGDFDRYGNYILRNAVGRTEGLREEYRTEFALGEDIQVTVVADGKGTVTIDGMKLPRANYTGTFFGGNKMLLKAEDGSGIFMEWEDGSKENPRLVTPKDGSKFVAKFK